MSRFVPHTLDWATAKGRHCNGAGATVRRGVGGRSRFERRRLNHLAAGPVLQVLSRPYCTAAVLAAAGAGGAVEALVAAAKREGDPHQANAFFALDAVAGADDGARERVASDAALLSIAVEQISAAAAGAASCDTVHVCQAALRLLNRLIDISAPAAARAQALATPGLAAATVGLLMALGSEEWAPAAVMEAWEAQRQVWEGPWWSLEAATLMAVAVLIRAGRVSCVPSFSALVPRVLALVRSPHQRIRMAASLCVAALAGTEAGRDALFAVPRAASELVAVLRRAHADGEDSRVGPVHVAHALGSLLCHSQGSRVAAGLARAAMAEGGAGSLLGALAGLLAASVDGAVAVELKWRVFVCAMAVLTVRLTAVRDMQLHLPHTLQRSPLAAACVRALGYWLAEASDEQMCALLNLVCWVASLAGWDPDTAGRIPSITEDTAAARVALREAPGMEGALQRFLSWARRAPQGDVTPAVAAAKWMLRLPEVKAPPAATGPAAAGPAPAARTAVPQLAGASLSSVQQPRDGGSSIGSSHGGGGGGGGGCAQAATPPRACGGCGRSEPEARLLRCAGCKAQHYCGDACARAHWPSHRAACKAAASARRPSATLRLQS
jgi:uncharacterized membrane protein YgcG